MFLPNSFIFLGPIVRKYKRYVDDPILPVQKRSMHYWKKTVNHTDPAGAEMLVPMTEISHDQTHINQDNAPPPTCRDTTESFCGLEEEDSVNDFDLPVQHQPFLLEDDTDASSYHPAYLSDSSDSSDSSATYITGSEFSESYVSDNDSNSCTSDEQSEKSDDPTTASSPNFTSKESASMAIISFSTRYLLSNEAASSFVELMKHLSPENKILQDLSYNKIQEMCGSCNLKVHDYCENCYGLFPDDKDVYSCQTANCTGKEIIFNNRFFIASHFCSKNKNYY